MGLFGKKKQDAAVEEIDIDGDEGIAVVDEEHFDSNELGDEQVEDEQPLPKPQLKAPVKQPIKLSQPQKVRGRPPVRPQEQVQAPAPEVQYVPVPEVVTEAEMLNLLWKRTERIEQAVAEILQKIKEAE